jgi:hypothetical protein
VEPDPTRGDIRNFLLRRVLGAVFTYVWAERHDGVRPLPGAAEVRVEKVRRVT